MAKKRIFAYKIENTDISRMNSDFSELFVKKVKDATKIKQRCYEVNSETHESDILTMYIPKNDVSMFGAIMRIVPSKESPKLPSDFLEMDSLDYSALEGVKNGDSKMSCRFYDYFSFDANHLVTTMPSSRISQFKSFANYFLEAESGNKIYKFTSMIEVPNGTKLEDISKIEFAGVISSDENGKPDGDDTKSLKTKILNVAAESLKAIFDDSDMSFLFDKNVLTASLVVKFNSRNKKSLEDDDVKKSLGAVVTSLADDEEVVLSTKDRKKITAGQVKRSKLVEIDEASGGWLNEEDMRTEMNAYLEEIKNIKR